MKKLLKNPKLKLDFAYESKDDEWFYQSKDLVLKFDNILVIKSNYSHLSDRNIVLKM